MPLQGSGFGNMASILAPLVGGRVAKGRKGNFTAGAPAGAVEGAGKFTPAPPPGVLGGVKAASPGGAGPLMGSGVAKMAPAPAPSFGGGEVAAGGPLAGMAGLLRNRLNPRAGAAGGFDFSRLAALLGRR